MTMVGGPKMISRLADASCGRSSISTTIAGPAAMLAAFAFSLVRKMHAGGANTAREEWFAVVVAAAS
jgi:hypothetical protein